MPPTRLGPYTIRGRLGRGGMGTVYEAADGDGTVVAVKTLTAHLGEDVGMRRRFEAEIEALKSLRHPGIVRLLAFGEEEGLPFFAMELVRGRSLEELLKDGRRFDWRQAVKIAAEIASALKAAHDQGIVHRDLKPANLLFPDDPGSGSVKLADFGIARLFGDASQTQAGTVVGTAEYMAPEQAAGEPVDARVDLYALGLVIYAMVTGRPPFVGGSMSEVLRRQRRETPPRVSEVVPDIPSALDDLVWKLLAKNPAERPASALAVGRMLAAVEEAGDAAAEPILDGEADASAATVAGMTAATGVGPVAATNPVGQGPTLGPPRAAGTDVAAIDGDAATRTFAAAAATGGSLAHRATAPNSVAAPADRAVPASRFMTVEQMHRAVREEADRTARRDRFVRMVVAAALMAAVVAAGYAVLQPATADRLYERIATVTSGPDADLRDAGSLIDEFLRRFPSDPRQPEVRGLSRRIQLDALERRARRRPRAEAPPTPLEREYRSAMEREAESPLGCLAALEAILALHAGETEATETATAETSLWLDLVRRQIDRIGPLAARERAEDAERARATLADAAALARQADAAEDADAKEVATARRLALLTGLIEIYAARPHVADEVAEARRQLDAGAAPLTPPAAEP